MATVNTSITAPPYRNLRVYAFDPSLSLDLDFAVHNEVTVPVPWEGNGRSTDGTMNSVFRSLQPGPIGDYVEVVDFDPASGCCYAPVDLDHPYLLAQDGLAPSEGNPQFHQQMVYAVAMTTIKNFERALGRLVLWSPRGYDRNKPLSDRERYVPRLRIYPHALRDANAYYSPEKKSLLFGYFPAAGSNQGRTVPGGTVFTCLSHDIVAHETTHALLDGLHRRFIEPSNPDVLAFHEAFADIVALFQHFSFPDVLRHQIAKTRGDLHRQNMLGQLAQEFGHAQGKRTALRDALGELNKVTGKWEPRQPDPQAYEKAREPHERGAILVAAIFETFLSIYQSRVADLLRIATGGTGRLPDGEISLDLVNRLASEAAKSSGHVLTMAIRALDYCPPVDLTFGEYLRAIITADCDLVADDDRGYRIALIEAFRRWGINPPDVRSLAIDSLRWREPTPTEHRRFGQAVTPQVLSLIASQSKTWDLSCDRREAYEQMKANCAILHGSLKKRVGSTLSQMMGLDFSRRGPKFEVHSVRPARRTGPDGQALVELVVEITQRIPIWLDSKGQWQKSSKRNGNTPDLWFRGGCTLLVDLETNCIRYCISKSISDKARLQRQINFLFKADEQSLRATYFSDAERRRGAEPFGFLHRDD